MKKPLIIEDGYVFILVPAMLAVLAWHFLSPYIAVLPGVFSLYFAYFFRNPPRRIPDDATILPNRVLL